MEHCSFSITEEDGRRDRGLSSRLSKVQGCRNTLTAPSLLPPPPPNPLAQCSGDDVTGKRGQPDLRTFPGLNS